MDTYNIVGNNLNDSDNQIEDAENFKKVESDLTKENVAMADAEDTSQLTPGEQSLVVKSTDDDDAAAGSSSNQLSQPTISNGRKEKVQSLLDEEISLVPIKAMTPNFESIPDRLKQQKQWLLWRYENRNSKKPTKVPYQPDGSRAKSNDSTTWSSFDECLEAFKKGGFDGIGYAFADDFVGIDLDSCRRQDKFEDWANNILKQFSSTYAEISPSGTGLHIICKGTPLATGEKKWKDPNYEKDAGVEAYNKGRYFCFTGNSISTNEITDCQPGLEWLYQEHFAESHEEPDYVRTDKGDVKLDVLREALEYVSANDYAQWIKVGMGLKDSGVSLEVWDEWSKKSSEYKPGICATKWPTFKSRENNKVTFGTIFHIAKQNGFKFPKDKTEEIDWTNPDSFGEVLPFDEIEGREISTDFLPKWVKDYVCAVAAHTQVEPGAVAVLALVVLASCVQMRFEVSVSPGYTEILSLWVFLTLPPASRKSAVFQALIAPVIEWEQEEAKRLQPQIAKEQTEIAVTKERIKELIRLAGKAEV